MGSTSGIEVIAMGRSSIIYGTKKDVESQEKLILRVGSLL